MAEKSSAPGGSSPDGLRRRPSQLAYEDEQMTAVNNSNTDSYESSQGSLNASKNWTNGESSSRGSVASDSLAAEESDLPAQAKTMQLSEDGPRHPSAAAGNSDDSAEEPSPCYYLEIPKINEPPGLDMRQGKSSDMEASYSHTSIPEVTTPHSPVRFKEPICHESYSDKDNEEQDPDAKDELPYPGFIPVAFKCLTQTSQPRALCLKLITWPYPFLKNIYKKYSLKKMVCGGSRCLYTWSEVVWEDFFIFKTSMSLKAD